MNLTHIKEICSVPVIPDANLLQDLLYDLDPHHQRVFIECMFIMCLIRLICKRMIYCWDNPVHIPIRSFIFSKRKELKVAR